MEVHIEDLEDETPGKNPLMLQSQYVSQLAGSGVYFQVKSSLTENPVRVVLHDRFSGKRKLLVITASANLGISTAGRVEPPAPKKNTIREITLPSGIEDSTNGILEVLLDETPPPAPVVEAKPPAPAPDTAPVPSPPAPSALKPPSPKIDVILAGTPQNTASFLKPPPVRK